MLKHLYGAAVACYKLICIFAEEQDEGKQFQYDVKFQFLLDEIVDITGEPFVDVQNKVIEMAE